MPRFALSLIGRDRPGIVAGVSSDLLSFGLNIEDSQMSILQGRFTTVLVVSGGEDVDVPALRTALQATAEGLGLDALSLSELSEAESGPLSEPSVIVTVYGADHPGIVHAVATMLAQHSINITDMQTRLVAEAGGDEIYAMMLELSLPDGLDQTHLEQLFRRVRSDQGVQVSVRELDRDVL
jgi:glycine cleavage system transcriptional repressor